MIAAVGCGRAGESPLVAAEPAAKGDAKAAPAEPPAPPHPLDPLTAEELAAMGEILKAAGKLTDATRFATVALREPDKEALAAFEAGRPAPPRKALAVLCDRAAGKTAEAVVDLSAKAVESFREIPGVQAMVLNEEYEAAAKIVAADEGWKSAIRKRGLKDADLEKVHVDVWAPGPVPESGGRRLLRALSFVRGEGTNPYGRPVEGVVAVVDVVAGKVVQLVDSGAAPLPADGADFFDPAYAKARKPAPAIRTVQPDGPGFAVRGHEVRWENWRFRWSMHPREGLVLHRVGWDDAKSGKVRGILHRASLSEMVVPYGDPSGTWNWRCAFDEGEYGLGRLATAVKPGREVPSHARVFGAVIADDLGKPSESEGVVAIYERDGGLLWRHSDDDSKKIAGRRARELVVTSVVTVGNYDYAFHWIFGRDGSLEFRVDLTGIVLARGVADAKCANCREDGRVAGDAGSQAFGPLAAPGVVATNHQHIFNLRLDFDIDGPANSVAELSARVLPPGPDNPRGNGWVIEENLLATEKAARREADPATGRRWKVFNPAVRNAQGHFTGYVLETRSVVAPLMTADAPLRKRAGFVAAPFWATRFKAAELYAAGDYVSQNPDPGGLPAFIADDEPLAGQDVVIWHTFGVSHFARPEDWPVMPAAHAGVRLVPHSFFDRNPALDVPEEE
jgi:primary-amine oxidase